MAMQLSFGWVDDVPELASLARAQLPSMTGLHEEPGWSTHNRFGPGEELFSNCTLVVRDEQSKGRLVGFLWADAAMYFDSEILEPWWCINALAIDAAYQRTGIGKRLVAKIAEIADAVGAVLLYGQSVPSAVPFWTASGFLVADEGEAVRTSSPALFKSGERQNFTADPGPGDRFFLKYLATEPGSVRSGLLPASLL